MPTTQWTGAAGTTDFNTAANWDNGVPSGTVAAVVQGVSAASLTVTLDNGSADAEALFMTDATLSVDGGPLVLEQASTLDVLDVSGGEIAFHNGDSVSVSTILGALTLNTGTVDIDTGTLALQNDAVLNGSISGTGTLVTYGTVALDGLTLTNGGTLSDDGVATLGDSFITINGIVEDGTVVPGFIGIEAGATFDLDGNGAIFSGDEGGTIVNAGLFEDTGGQSGVYAMFDSTGTVLVSDGTLLFESQDDSNPSIFSGLITGDGTIQYVDDTMWAAGLTVNVAAVEFPDKDAELLIAADVTYDARVLDLSYVTVALEASFTILPTTTVSLNNAVIEGQDDFVTTGTQAAAGVDIEANVTLDNRGLDTITNGYVWLGEEFGGTPSAINEAGATLELENGGILHGNGLDSDYYPGFQPDLYNDGLLELTAGDGNINVGVFSTGTIAVESGTLLFDGDGSFGGLITGPGTVAFANGFIDGPDGSVPQNEWASGLVLNTTAVDVVDGVVIGADVGLQGNLSAASTTLQFGTDPSQTGSLTLAATTVADLDNSILSGNGTLVSNGQLAMDGLTIGNGIDVDNQGTATFGDGMVQIGTDVAGTALIVNTGLLEKNSGTGTMMLQPAIDNAGRIAADSGDLQLYSVTNDGTLAVTGTGELDVFSNLETTGSIAIQDDGIMKLVGIVGVAQTVQFYDDTGSLVLAEPGAFSGTITGFAQDGANSDSIDLVGLTGLSKSYDTTLDTLTLTHDGTVAAQLKFTGDYVESHFILGPSDDGTSLTYSSLCFLAGTRIATPSGEVPVEELSVGDVVLTASGASRPVTWIGEGCVMATRGRRSAATPVIVKAGALGHSVPTRDLHVTKGHALLLDDVLIPVEFLVNHRTIIWNDHAQDMKLYHIELDRHDVLLANGAPAESYRDDGNRWLFRNANAGWVLPQLPACAPVLTGGPVVDAVWSRLLQRAAPRPLPLTAEADLHLMADGERVDAHARTERFHVFSLPRVPAVLRIASRSAIPSELGIGRDHRPLGIALRRIVLRQGARSFTLEADDPSLDDGFHAFEASCQARWTCGDAKLPDGALSGFRGPIEVVLQLGGATRYLDPGVSLKAKAA